MQRVDMYPAAKTVEELTIQDKALARKHQCPDVKLLGKQILTRYWNTRLTTILYMYQEFNEETKKYKDPILDLVRYRKQHTRRGLLYYYSNNMTFTGQGQARAMAMTILKWYPKKASYEKEYMRQSETFTESMMAEVNDRKKKRAASKKKEKELSARSKKKGKKGEK